MKKIIKNLLIAILAIIPITVFADMGAPEIPSFDAIITSKSGADTYAFVNGKLIKKGHLNEGTKIFVEFGETIDKKSYVVFKANGNDNLYVEASNILPAKDEITPADINWQKEKYSGYFWVYNEDIKLMKGPFESFGSYTTLEKGTKGRVMAKYSGSQYVYVSINGQKGWLDRLGRKVLTSDDTIYVVGENLKTSCGTIPANTTFSSSWEASPWDSFGNNGEINLVTYKGCETFIPTFKSENVASIRDINDSSTKPYFKAGIDLKVYEDISLSKEIGSIPKGEVLGVIGYPGAMGSPAYVEHGNIKGWVEDPLSADVINLMNYNVGSEGHDRKEYETALEEYNTFKKNLLAENNKEEKTEDNIEEKKDEEENTDVETIGAKKEEKDSRDIIIICLIAALAFTCGALATIALTNKKKSNKQENKEEE